MRTRRTRAAAPPLAALHPRTWELLRLESIYEPSAARDALFVEAVRENTRWHLDRNPAYRMFCEYRHFDLDRDLQSIQDLDRLPALGADVVKTCNLVTLRHVNYFTVASSGTGGRPTTIPLDLETVLRMWTMGEASFAEEGLRSEEPVDYAILAPDPQWASGHGNAQFFHALTEAAPAREVVYGLVLDDKGSWRVDLARAADHLTRWAAAGRPVRVLGVPALVVKLAERFVGGPIRLADDSLVLTGTGWKKDVHMALPKADVRALLQQVWGVSPERIRDLYGMTEHAVHYLECRAHRFHAPVFARARVVDPLTGVAVQDGREGVLHLVNPGFTTLPVQSLVTSDVGRAWGACGCGRRTPSFEIIGRGGTSHFRGCAATTLERVAS
jgi:Acyl-protein synthetase, LuxE